METSKSKQLYILGPIACFAGAIAIEHGALAGEITYTVDSYESGQVLEHADLNNKFNQIRTAVNDNHAKSTLSELSCNSGQVATWNGAAWSCAHSTFVVSESVTDPDPFLLDSETRKIQSIVVSAPGPGNVAMSFSATYKIAHTTGTLDEIWVGISEDNPSATVSELPNSRYLSLSSTFANGVFFGSVALHKVLRVPAAGTYTYYVLGSSNKGNPTNSIYVSRAATQAIYVPDR